nr:CHC2 zinc finger domain-containing protein [uncultured Desulfobacter sp.]
MYGYDNTTHPEKINQNNELDYGQAAKNILTHARGYDRQDTTAAIKNIDLVALVQAHGVNLKKSGTRYVDLCPFHDDKTPSFFVYPNNSFYCFGCGIGGDAATFIMKMYGCSFPEALEKLGIKKTSGAFSCTQVMQIKKVKAKRALLESFRAWEAEYSSRLGKLITSAYQCLSRVKTEDDLNKVAWVHKPLTVWKYHLDVLCYGTDKDKYKLFREVSNG